MTLFRIRIRHDILWIRLSYRASQLNNLCRAFIKGGGRVDGGGGGGAVGGGGGGRGVVVGDGERRLRGRSRRGSDSLLSIRTPADT